MKQGNGNHLMYCLNIHPGETLREVKQAIVQHAADVKARFCPSEPMALGLRLSRVATTELLPATADFRQFLDDHGFYVVSINGFPYGRFHGTRIKENVYLPDWTSTERATYTIDLASILSQILPEGERGTISTVPCHYGRDEKPAASDNLLSVAEELGNIERRTGRRIMVALEPEPDCLLDSQASTVVFFERLFQRHEPSRRYLGVCLDCCHAAVVFESPFQWLRAFHAHGISVPKIQVSASLRIEVQGTQRELLKPFVDPQYLHQTRVASNGQILHFADLPQAVSDAPDGEWRIHFHVPLHWRGNPVRSTIDTMENEFFLYMLSAGNRHLEVETYSFDLVPGEKLPLVHSILCELQWLQQKLYVHESHARSKSIDFQAIGHG